MKFQDPMSITCKSCNHVGRYKVDLLLAYKAKCNKCDSNFDYASDQMNGLLDELNETYELLQVVLGIQEHFGQEYKGEEIENIKTIQDLLSVTAIEFSSQEYDRIIIKKELLRYLEDKYKCDIKELDTSILSALGIEVKTRKRG